MPQQGGSSPNDAKFPHALHAAYAEWQARGERSPHEVDVMHDVLLSHATDSGFPASAPKRPVRWLESCARNRAVDLIRDMERHVLRVTDALLRRPRAQPIDGPTQHMGREVAARVVAAILELKPIERRALLCRDWRGLANWETALEIFGNRDHISQVAVSRAATRARRQLQDRLTAEFGDDAATAALAADRATVCDLLSKVEALDGGAPPLARPNFKAHEKATGSEIEEANAEGCDA